MKIKFLLFIICCVVVLATSSCSKESFEESSTVRNYDGINVTITQNSAFSRELKIKYEIKKIPYSQKKKMQRMFPGIYFSENSYASYKSEIENNNSITSDANSLFEKADKIIRDLGLIKNDNVSFFKKEYPNSNGTGELKSISLGVMHSYKNILACVYGLLELEISDDNVTRFAYLNTSFTFKETGKILKLLPVEPLVDKYFERLQKLKTYSNDKFEDMICVPSYYLKDEKFIPVWMIGEGADGFLNTGYIDAITGEIYEWPYR